MERPLILITRLLAIASTVTLLPLVFAKVTQLPSSALSFLEDNCLDCHDSSEQKGDLNLESLGFDLNNPDLFSQWVEIHDRVVSGEMPPKKALSRS